MADIINKEPIIKLDHIDYSDIKDDLYNYLQNRDDWGDIKEILASNIDMFINMMSGYATYTSYKYRQMRQETYLTTAKMASSIYQIAKTFGYNINRFHCPTIRVKYDDVPTLTMKPGMKLGTYGKYELVYFGKPDVIERGEYIELHIGNYQSQELADDSLIVTQVEPMFLTSVHNKMFVEVDDKIIEVSRSVEDYLIYKTPVDFSDDIYKSNVELKDVENSFGLFDTSFETLTLHYMETDGFIGTIEFSKIDLDDRFIYDKVGTSGTNGDSLEFIKKISPFYFSTLRRMVTVTDHKHILSANEFIKEVFIERDDGKPKIYHLTPNKNGETEYRITINNKIYKYEIDSTDEEVIMQTLYDKLKNKSNFNVELVNPRRLAIMTLNGRDINDFVVDVTDNLNLNISNQGFKPICCTINCWFIKYNVTQDPILFSETEMTSIAEYAEKFKMAGVKLSFLPAQKISKELNINIKVADSSLHDLVKDEILKIVSTYELSLDKDFTYGEFLSRVSRLEVEYNNSIIKPIDYISPNQEMYDIKNDGKNYILFDTIINFIE